QRTSAASEPLPSQVDRQDHPRTMRLTRRIRLLVPAATVILVFSAAFVRSYAQSRVRPVVFVEVRHHQGGHISGLRAANFKAEYRGQPITIVSVTEDSAPRRVVVVVDISASQAESALSEWTQAEQLIDGLIPQHSVAVFTVDRTLRKFADFTTERSTV